LFTAKSVGFIAPASCPPDRQKDHEKFGKNQEITAKNSEKHMEKPEKSHIKTQIQSMNLQFFKKI
jgi:hypothetical protein